MIQLPTAVSGVNNNRTEPSELIQERSIFEHVNGNLRSSVTLAQNHVNGNVVNGTGSVDTAVEARITTDPSRVTVGEEKQETTGIFLFWLYISCLQSQRKFTDKLTAVLIFFLSGALYIASSLSLAWKSMFVLRSFPRNF